MELHKSLAHSLNIVNTFLQPSFPSRFMITLVRHISYLINVVHQDILNKKYDGQEIKLLFLPCQRSQEWQVESPEDEEFPDDRRIPVSD